MSSEMPSHIGPYRITQQLGAGGMGVVYRAEDENLGREVAIKVLHPHLLKDEEHKERFRREARVHAQLMHPNVVTLLALHEDDEHMALVMEMIHGKDLKEYLKAEENYPIADLLQIALKILSGLEAAHQLGLVHRDLKPANILIADTGEIKLMDFGLAKSSKGDDDLTQTGATVGSFRYMAPEQITNQPLDHRTDIYSFGILLYQMVTGKLPFDATAAGGGEFAIMEKQVRELAIPPHEVNPEVPLALSDLIMRMLAKDPDERPADCAAVRQELEEIVQNLSSKASAPSFSRMAENATKYFEKAGEEQWGKVKQASSNRWASVMTSWKQNPKTTWVVGGSALAMLLLGWAVIALIGNTEDMEGASKQVTTPAVVSMPAPSVPEVKQATPKSETTPEQAKQVEKAPAKSDKKPEKKKAVTKKPVKSKPKPKPKVKKKPKPKVVEKDILDRVSYKVRRNHSGTVDIHKPHEFHGGSHEYFKNLEVTHEKTFFTKFKRAEVRLYFYEVVHLKAIVIEQASVHGALFDGNEIKMEVQDEHFKWHTVVEMKKHDISKPLRIEEKDLPKWVKSVRVNLRSSSPLTLGPIRLLE